MKRSELLSIHIFFVVIFIAIAISGLTISSKIDLANAQLQSMIAKELVRQRVGGDQCHSDSRHYSEIAYPALLYRNITEKEQLREKFQQVYTANNCL